MEGLEASGRSTSAKAIHLDYLAYIFIYGHLCTKVSKNETTENRLNVSVLFSDAGSQVKCIKNRIDELDLENFSYKYSLIEGDGLLNKLDKITYDVKFEPTPDGGSKNKMSSTYYTKGDMVLTEDEIKEGKEKALGMYKIVEAYLLQNPDAYV